MIVQVFAAPPVVSWFDEFMRGWLASAPHDCLSLQVVAVSGLSCASALPVLPPRLLKLSVETDLFLVFSPEITDEPGVGDLSSLVVSRVLRRGIQPVVALAVDTPLSRRQLAESGLSAAYLLTNQPGRSLQDWGRVLGQTWHHD